MFGRKKRKHDDVAATYEDVARAHLEAAGIKNPEQYLSAEAIEEMVRSARSGEAYAQRDAMGQQAQQGTSPAPPPDPVDELARIADLHAQGLISDAQLAEAKARLLG